MNSQQSALPLEDLGRMENDIPGLIPVKHQDLKRLVQQIDELKSSLEFKFFAELQLRDYVTKHASDSETYYAITALRLLRDQAMQISAQNLQISRLKQLAGPYHDDAIVRLGEVLPNG